MEQEITIIVMVDVRGALESMSLDNHIYMMDNLRTQGSTEEGTAHLTSALNANVWFNGSQANEPLINWLPYGVGMLPPTLPRNYHKVQAKRYNEANVKSIFELAENAGKASGTQGFITSAQLREKLAGLKDRKPLKTSYKPGSKSRTNFGGQDSLVLGPDGNILKESDKDNAATLIHVMPLLTGLSGEAVDKGIIYPAQYGTPIDLKAGWYWSATSGTRPGVYGYTMHLTLFDLIELDGQLEWNPVHFTHDAKLEVFTRSVTNGFTHAGISFLPLNYF